MKKRFLLALVACSLSLAGCGKKDEEKPSDPPSQDPGETGFDPGELTPTEKTEATKAKTLLTSLMTSEFDEQTIASIDSYLVSYSEEFAKKGGNSEKVEGYITTASSSNFNGIMDVLEFFSTVGIDEGIDDSVYFAVCYAKSALRAEAVETPNIAEPLGSLVADIEKEGEAIPAHLIALLNAIYKTYVRFATSAYKDIEPFVTDLTEGEILDGEETRRAYVAAASLIKEITVASDDLSYLVTFVQQEFVKHGAQLIPQKAITDYVLPILQLIDFNEIFADTFNLIAKVGETLESMPEEYYSHLDAIEVKTESYVYAALGVLERFAEVYQISDAEIERLIGLLIDFIKGIYPTVLNIAYDSEVSETKSHIRRLTNYMDSAVRYAYPAPTSVDEVLEILNLNNYSEEDLVPYFENSDFFWDQENNKIIYAQRESKDSPYVLVYPKNSLEEVTETEYWHSLNADYPENYEIRVEQPIPGFVETIVKSPNFKAALISLTKLFRGYEKLQSLTPAKIAYAAGRVEGVKSDKVHARYYIGNPEEMPESVIDLLPLAEYNTAVKNHTNFYDKDVKIARTNTVDNGNGTYTFTLTKVDYDISYTCTKTGEESYDEYTYSFIDSDVCTYTYSSLQPIGDLAYDLFAELASKKTLTDSFVNKLGALFTNVKALWDEVEPQIGMPAEDEEIAEGYISIVDSFLCGENKELLQKTINDVFVCLKDILGAFVSKDGSVADVNFSETLILLLDDYLTMEMFEGKISASSLASTKVLLGDAYDCLEASSFLEMVLGKLAKMFENKDIEEYNRAQFIDLLYDGFVLCFEKA